MTGLTLAQQRGVTRLVRTSAELGRSLGRADESDQLEAGLAALTGPVVTAVTGEPGSGATALTLALADAAPDTAPSEEQDEEHDGAARPDGDGALPGGPLVRRLGDMLLLDPGAVPHLGELGGIDLVVWTHRGDQPMRARELAALAAIAPHRPVVLAVTMADAVPEVAVVVAEIELALASAAILAPVLTVSAQLAGVLTGLPEEVRATAETLAGVAALAARLRQDVQDRVIPARYRALLDLAHEACERVVADQRTELDPIEQRRAQLSAEIARLEPLAQRAAESSRRVDQMVHDALALPRVFVEDEVRALRQGIEERLGESPRPGEDAVVEQLTVGMADLTRRALAYQETILATMSRTVNDCFGVRPLVPPPQPAESAQPAVRLAASTAAPSQGWIPVVLQSAGIGGLVVTAGGTLAGSAGTAAAASVLGGPIGFVAAAVAVGVATIARRRIARTADVTARRDLTVRVREACTEAQRQLVRALSARQEVVAREWRLAGAGDQLVRRLRELRRARDQVEADPRAAAQLRTSGDLLSRLSAARSSLRGIESGELEGAARVETDR